MFCIILKLNFRILKLVSQVSSTDTEDNAQIVQGLSGFLLGLAMLYNNCQTNETPSLLFSVEELKDTIRKRIGLEEFSEKLEYISQHDFFTRTLKQRTSFSLSLFTLNNSSIKPKHQSSSFSYSSSSLLFDYEFTRLFKSNETLINNFILNNNGLVSRIEEDYKKTINSQQINLNEQILLNQKLEFNLKQLQEYCTQLIQQQQQQEQHQITVNSSQQEAIGVSAAIAKDKLQMQARINELEVKCNLLEEK